MIWENLPLQCLIREHISKTPKIYNRSFDSESRFADDNTKPCIMHAMSEREPLIWSFGSVFKHSLALHCRVGVHDILEISSNKYISFRHPWYIGRLLSCLNEMLYWTIAWIPSGYKLYRRFIVAQFPAFLIMSSGFAVWRETLTSDVFV